MFRNVRFYRVSSPWPETEAALSALLAKCSFVPVGPLADKRSGWESPTGQLPREGAELSYCRRVGGADLLRLRTQSRLLPAAAINEALETRIAEFRERMQEEPSRRQLRRLKEETRDELLPKALTKSERIDGFYLHADKLLGIDAASVSKAERFIDLLRATLEGFEFTPLAFSQPIGDLLNSVFLGEQVPGLTIGSECRMQDLSEEKATANWRNTNLADNTVRQHVIDGMKLTHLGMEYNELLSFVLAEDGAISKLSFPATDPADVSDEEDPLALQDASFVLLTGTLRELIQSLHKQLGGYATVAAEHADAA
ncbi:MAG: recombination-associated protein RdgC [Gammaproteobacteria bacterium]|nr:recombination-associated protein RdgC [Gammaproteobacteria bacterium]